MGSAMIPGLIGCLLLSCAGPHSSGSAGATSPSPQTTPVTPLEPQAASPSPASRSPGALPRVNSGQPKAFARELDRSVATLRDRRSTPAEVRWAGQFQQLAVRLLAGESSAFRRAVLARTGHLTAAILTSDLRAARSLTELTAPEKRLPPWRIMSPPPVNELRRYYADAQRLTGVPWTFLAAINLVETRMGRIQGTSPAGTQGPMQFMRATWATYGAGGDINDPRDAILGAARLLQANGASKDMSAALYRYNPSRHYVLAITQYAHTMQRAPYTFRGYWHWQVLYRDTHGLYLLPEGYPRVHAVLLEPR